jgi:hypothetical protein
MNQNPSFNCGIVPLLEFCMAGLVMTAPASVSDSRNSIFSGHHSMQTNSKPMKLHNALAEIFIADKKPAAAKQKA